jgi:hypothetical protein
LGALKTSRETHLLYFLSHYFSQVATLCSDLQVE